MNWKKLLTAVGFAALAVVPIAVTASTASATESMYNCSITALKPEWRPLSNGTKQVRGVATVHCGQARNVSVQIGVREADFGSAYDTYVAPYWLNPVYIAAGSRASFYTSWVHCANTELGNEEVYVLARMSVNGYASAWDSGRNGLNQISMAC